MQPKNNNEINDRDNNKDDKPFCDRPFQEVEDGYIDDRGFYTTPNGSFWDDDGTYFDHLGFDSHGGSYDKYGIYHPGPDYDEKSGLYFDQKEYIISNDKADIKKTIEKSILKLKEQEKDDEKIIKKYEQPVEESEDSDDEDKSNITYDENDIKEAYESVLEQQIELGEILNPEIYTGIIERDFHLYIYKPKKQPEYVHIEADEKPKCTCKMHNKDIDLESGEKCFHILFIINDILQLNSENENLIYSKEELKHAFEQAEKKYGNIVRETYGITKRKNFEFPNPKIYKYEFDEKNNDEYQRNEWRIKERLYSRGIVADEIIFPGIDYSLIEQTYNNYFYSDKDAKPTGKAYIVPQFTGRQLVLDKIFKQK